MNYKLEFDKPGAFEFITQFNVSAYMLLPLCGIYTGEAREAGLVNTYLHPPYEVDMIFNQMNKKFLSFEQDLMRNPSVTSNTTWNGFIRIRVRIPKEYIQDADLMINEGKYSDIDIKTKEQILKYFILIRKQGFGIFSRIDVSKEAQGADGADRQKWIKFLEKEFDVKIDPEAEVWSKFNLEKETIKV